MKIFRSQSGTKGPLTLVLIRYPFLLPGLQSAPLSCGSVELILQVSLS